jgi:rfaE bifunctional protein kinase chain/domain
MNTFTQMKKDRLQEILSGVKNVRAAVFGDLCIDVYWHADMTKSELSRETPHFAMPVVDERISLGGGGNVAANMAALRPKSVSASGTAGEDWRGREMMSLFHALNINTTHIVTAKHLITNAFCKPLRKGFSDAVYEDPRLDFANIKPLGAAVEDALIASLDAIAPHTDILCISDQLPPAVRGAVTERVLEHILKLAESGLTVVADSRVRIGRYRNCIIKPNDLEGAQAAGISDPVKAALKLSEDREVVMTMGAKGSVYAANGEITHIPARRVTGAIDIVGAGDAFIAGFSLALAAGASRAEAAYVAGLCSEVTIQKIGTTGTASAEEVLKRHEMAG